MIRPAIRGERRFIGGVDRGGIEVYGVGGRGRPYARKRAFTF